MKVIINAVPALFDLCCARNQTGNDLIIYDNLSRKGAAENLGWLRSEWRSFLNLLRVISGIMSC